MAVPTLYVVDGFEHGLATATSGTGVYDTASGSPAIVASPVRTGARALEITASGAAEYVGYTWAASNRHITMSFYVRFASLPAGDGVRVCQVYTAGGNSHLITFRTAAGGGPCFAVNASGTVSNLAGTVAINTWYRIDVDVNTSANPHVVKARVDGGTEASANAALAASDISGGRLGTNANETITTYYDDWVISLDGTTDYPIGAHYVEQLLPTGDGSHNVNGANTFERTATGTDITNATTDAYLLVDDAQIDTTPTDYINQVAGASTDYVEVTFANPATQGDTPIDVRGYVSYMDGAATGTTTSGCDFYDTDTTYATLSTAVKAHADTGNTTIKTYANSAANSKLLTRPAGGWNITKVNALRARVGYGDGTPDGFFSTVMAEVAMQPPTTQNYTLSHTVKNITFTGGTHTKTPIHNYTLSSTTKNITFTAGTHTKTFGRSLSHTTKNITFAAGTHTSTPVFHYTLSSTTENITFGAGTHTKTYARTLSSTTKNITFGAGTHSSTYTPGASGVNYTLSATVKNITFTAGTHTMTRGVYFGTGWPGYGEGFGAPTIQFTGGTHTSTPVFHYTLSNVTKNITFSAGTHTSTYTDMGVQHDYTLSHAVKNITFSVGVHTLQLARLMQHAVANITFGAGTNTSTPVHHYALSGVVKNITFTAGTHTSTPTHNYTHESVTRNITFTGNDHTKTYRNNAPAPFFKRGGLDVWGHPKLGWH